MTIQELIAKRQKRPDSIKCSAENGRTAAVDIPEDTVLQWDMLMATIVDMRWR